MRKSNLGKDLAIGVDIGGTKIRAGLVNSKGEVAGASIAVNTIGSDVPDAIIGRILGSIDSLISKEGIRQNDIRGIGMGVTGPIDIGKGIILECPQLPTLHYYPLKKKIEESFQFPVWMNNDANAMILGEGLWGAGKGYSMVLGFTLGTGLGCAIVSNKKIISGHRELAGEIWPSPYRGMTIEDYVSGRGISSMYEKIAGRVKSAFEISRLGFEGDADALAVWHEFGEALGFCLAWTINFLDPDVVVLGGSISNSIDLFGESMHKFINRYSCPSPASAPPVFKANLTDDAGFIGGAALVFTEQ